MDREQLVTDLVAADPQPGDLVYVERRGDDYRWERAGGSGAMGADGADAWIFYAWQRELGDPCAARVMVDDLLAEMESMTGCGDDRCRWSLDQPWPMGH